MWRQLTQNTMQKGLLIEKLTDINVWATIQCLSVFVSRRNMRDEFAGTPISGNAQERN